MKSYDLPDWTLFKDCGMSPSLLLSSFRPGTHVRRVSSYEDNPSKPTRLSLYMNADLDKYTRANDISAELIIDTDTDEANSIYNSTNESKGSHGWIVFIKQDSSLRVRSVAKKEESELRASELLVWYVRIFSMKMVYRVWGEQTFDAEQKILHLTGHRILSRILRPKLSLCSYQVSRPSAGFDFWPGLAGFPRKNLLEYC